MFHNTVKGEVGHFPHRPAIKVSAYYDFGPWKSFLYKNGIKHSPAIKVLGLLRFSDIEVFSVDFLNFLTIIFGHTLCPVKLVMSVRPSVSLSVSHKSSHSSCHEFSLIFCCK